MGVVNHALNEILCFVQVEPCLNDDVRNRKPATQLERQLEDLCFVAVLAADQVLRTPAKDLRQILSLILELLRWST